MRGKLWIERSSFQWVKVAVEVFRPVSIGGFIARVEPGTRMELEQQQVSSDIWLPSHLAVRSHSKVMFVFGHQTDEEQTFFDYHPAKNFEPPAGRSQSRVPLSEPWLRSESTAASASGKPVAIRPSLGRL